MTVSSSIEGTAQRLSELLPTVDLSDSSLQWQALLLSNYSAHVFIPHGVKIFPPTLWQAVVESSVAQLSTRAEIADLRLQNRYLKTVQHSLESEIKEVEGRNRRQERLIADLAQQVELSRRNHKHSRPSTPLIEASPSTHRSVSPSSSKTATSPSADVMPGGYIDKPIPPNPPIDHDDDLLYAMGLQHEFEVEDNTLFSQRTELVGSSQPEFTCDICMEEMPVDSIACPDPCGHTFCRECLRGHVTARLDEHRFPILCPTCTADKDKGKGSVGGACRMCSLARSLM
jgi:Ring finger domain